MIFAMQRIGEQQTPTPKRPDASSSIEPSIALDREAFD